MRARNGHAQASNQRNDCGRSLSTFVRGSSQLVFHPPLLLQGDAPIGVGSLGSSFLAAASLLSSCMMPFLSTLSAYGLQPPTIRESLATFFRRAIYGRRGGHFVLELTLSSCVALFLVIGLVAYFCSASLPCCLLTSCSLIEHAPILVSPLIGHCFV